jgi:hypothetical protein
LPVERREARILACRPWAGTALGGAWRFYDLCPTPAVLRSLIAHVATFTRARDERRDARTGELLRAGAASVHAELEAGIAGKAPRRDLYALALGRELPPPKKTSAKPKSGAPIRRKRKPAAR